MSQLVQLYGYEALPEARRIRELLCTLEIPYVVHNVAKGSDKALCGPPSFHLFDLCCRETRMDVGLEVLAGVIWIRVLLCREQACRCHAVTLPQRVRRLLNTKSSTLLARVRSVFRTSAGAHGLCACTGRMRASMKMGTARCHGLSTPPP
eukprot:1533091-Rhodomonas_salina.1